MHLIFADTNVFIAMFCIPENKERPHLGQEIRDLLLEGIISISITDVIFDEFAEVVRRKQITQNMFAMNKHIFDDSISLIKTEYVANEVYKDIEAVCVDENDIDVLASIIYASSDEKETYLLSNDFENFHTDAMKMYLATHRITPISMYGVLKHLGRR